MTCICMDKPEGSYITTMVCAFNNDQTGELNNKWKIFAFTSRRADNKNAKPNERNSIAMLKREELNYELEAIVAVVIRKKEDASGIGDDETMINWF